ncbi:relaxase/mobilization nuclease domain-containing protein [Xanthomonas campestris pv. campestris]|uniref:DUF3363 domain-containing protein n=1 Tax=Xanthomonas campestris TaxID=339 RepID=UPI001E48F6AD|nr:DUF3363 domain-containing protein [Xanthomonas campestris]MCD0253097.1 relaxase/mobilization nuclease domain-containing protein [Xanthomonas campestris pv. campestris]
MATKKVLSGSDSPAIGNGDNDGDGPDHLLDRAPVIRFAKSGIKGQRTTFKGYRQLMTVVRDGRSARARKKLSSGGLRPARTTRVAPQRVAVRLTYGKNKLPGSWRAHGRYLERESATGRGGSDRGFGSAGDDMKIASTLDGWQKGQDPHIFKLIISPENGKDLDLREFTKAYMAKLETELGTRLEWVGADHYNTDDPHVHVALRGRDEHGQPMRIPREFIKGPLRHIAGQLATERLGHRTQADISDARERQVKQHRWTDLDRTLKRMEQGGEVDFSTPLHHGATPERKQMRNQLLGRLSTLESMGLARRGEGGRWALDPMAETILRERQKANDRLKVMHTHRAMVSDPRLPLAATPEGDIRLSGRLIGTGIDDSAQRDYLLLESTRGSVIYLYQSPSFEVASSSGMRPGDFLVITQKTTPDAQGRPRTSQFVRAYGDADKALADPKILRSEIRHHIERTGSMPAGSVWGGWLGRFHGELAREAQELAVQGVVKQVGNQVVMAPPAKSFKRAPGTGAAKGPSRGP